MVWPLLTSSTWFFCSDEHISKMLLGIFLDCTEFWVAWCVRGASLCVAEEGSRATRSWKRKSCLCSVVGTVYWARSRKTWKHTVRAGPRSTIWRRQKPEQIKKKNCMINAEPIEKEIMERQERTKKKEIVTRPIIACQRYPRRERRKFVISLSSDKVLQDHPPPIPIFKKYSTRKNTGKLGKRLQDCTQTSFCFND